MRPCQGQRPAVIFPRESPCLADGMPPRCVRPNPGATPLPVFTRSLSAADPSSVEISLRRLDSWRAVTEKDGVSAPQHVMLCRPDVDMSTRSSPMPDIVGWVHLTWNGYHHGAGKARLRPSPAAECAAFRPVCPSAPPLPRPRSGAVPSQPLIRRPAPTPQQTEPRFLFIRMHAP